MVDLDRKQQIEASCIGHPLIRQDNVDRTDGQQFHRLADAGRRLDGVPGLLEQQGEMTPYVLVVVYDEEPEPAGGRGVPEIGRCMRRGFSMLAWR